MAGRKRRPLHLAARDGDFGTLYALLGGGADPNERDEQGDTAASIAARNANYCVHRCLATYARTRPAALVPRVNTHPLSNAVILRSHLPAHRSVAAGALVERMHRTMSILVQHELAPEDGPAVEVTPAVIAAVAFFAPPYSFLPLHVDPAATCLRIDVGDDRDTPKLTPFVCRKDDGLPCSDTTHALLRKVDAILRAATVDNEHLPLRDEAFGLLLRVAHGYFDALGDAMTPLLAPRSDWLVGDEGARTHDDVSDLVTSCARGVPLLHAAKPEQTSRVFVPVRVERGVKCVEVDALTAGLDAVPMTGVLVIGRGATWVLHGTREGEQRRVTVSA